MPTRSSWAPKHIEFDKPSPARLYDYLLGGACNSAADRKLANEVLAKLPHAPRMMWINRYFMRRVVRYLAGLGIRQFLDLGSGIPSVGNVHEIAQQIDPRCRVVYVDHDPIAAAHGKLLLQNNELADLIQQDARDYEAVLRAPEVKKLLNFNEPVAILMLMFLHSIPDSDDPAGLVAHYRDAMAPGSYLACSHGTTDANSGTLEPALQLYQSSMAPATFRKSSDILDLLSGFTLVTPGLVYLSQWRPDTPEDVGIPSECCMLGAVGRK